jgi:Polyketide cyclase / dehydrase and lipid transport
VLDTSTREKMVDMGESKGPFGGSSRSSASAEDVWAVWTDPAEWPGDVIVTAKIDGPFAVGAKVTMRVKGHPPLTLTITRIEPPRLWTGVARVPGFTETIDHRVEPTDSGTLITQRSVFTGPLAPIAARLLGGMVRKTFAATTAHFARLAERPASH